MCLCGFCYKYDICQPFSFVYRNAFSCCCDPVLDFCDGTTLTQRLHSGDRGAAHIYRKGSRYPYPLKKRYAVIREGKLIIYKDSSRKQIENQISLTAAKVMEANYSEYAKYKITIYFPNNSSSMSSISMSLNEGIANSNLNERVIYLSTHKQVRLWTELIEAEVKFLELQGSKNGFLSKKGGRLMTKWQKRFCHLTGGKLEYFEEGSPYPKGTISVVGGTVKRTNNRKMKNFELTGFDPTTHQTLTREFGCPDEQTREEWIQAIERQINYSDFEAQYRNEEVEEARSKDFFSLEEKDSRNQALLPDEHDRMKLLKPKPMQEKIVENNVDSGNYIPPSPSISPSSQSETEMTDKQGGGGTDEQENIVQFKSRASKPKSDKFDRLKPKEIEGFLSKSAGTGIGRYQKRYFILHYPGIVKYYKGEPTDKKTHSDQKALGFINLFDVVDGGVSANQMDILIDVGTRVFRLRCSDTKQREEWLTSLKEWSVYSKEYVEWINERKKYKEKKEGNTNEDSNFNLKEATVVDDARL